MPPPGVERVGVFVLGVEDQFADRDQRAVRLARGRFVPQGAGVKRVFLGVGRVRAAWTDWSLRSLRPPAKCRRPASSPRSRRTADATRRSRGRSSSVIGRLKCSPTPTVSPTSKCSSKTFQPSSVALGIQRSGASLNSSRGSIAQEATAATRTTSQDQRPLPVDKVQDELKKLHRVSPARAILTRGKRPRRLNLTHERLVPSGLPRLCPGGGAIARPQR